MLIKCVYGYFAKKKSFHLNEIKYYLNFITFDWYNFIDLVQKLLIILKLLNNLVVFISQQSYRFIYTGWNPYDLANDQTDLPLKDIKQIPN